MTGGNRQRSSLAGSSLAFGLEGGVQRGAAHRAKRIQEFRGVLLRCSRGLRGSHAAHNNSFVWAAMRKGSGACWEGAQVCAGGKVAAFALARPEDYEFEPGEARGRLLVGRLPGERKRPALLVC